MSKGKRNRDRHRSDVGLRRRRRDDGPCGLCGSIGPLSRTHVPPQCAGNDHGVQRIYFHIIQANGEQALVRSNRRLHGGLYVYGLCGDCNSAASKWDVAYKQLSDILQSCWVKGSLIVPGNRIALPSAQCVPSAVARSVLMGLFGVNHVLRERFPDLAANLLNGLDPIDLPADVQLRVALARGTVGRLTGAMHSMKVLNTQSGVIEKMLSDASVYFPPLAWQLVSRESSYLDAQGWGDASSWLSAPIGERRSVSDLCHSLPLVQQPSQDPNEWDSFVHLYADTLTPIVECTGLLLEP